MRETPLPTQPLDPFGVTHLQAPGIGSRTLLPGIFILGPSRTKRLRELWLLCSSVYLDYRPFGICYFRLMRNETTVLEKEELRKGDICYLNGSTQANWRKGI